MQNKKFLLVLKRNGFQTVNFLKPSASYEEKYIFKTVEVGKRVLQRI